MSLYQNLITMVLAASGATKIALSQGPVTGAFTINGSLATGGVATLDVPRRVLITSAGNDSGITFTVTGTGANGLALSEVLTGGNATGVYTNHDFATVTGISSSAATASTVEAGTNGVGSSIPVIVDTIVNPANYGVAVTVTGTVTYTVEMSYDDFAPLFDLNANTPTWFPASGFNSQTSNQNGNIVGPCTMIRLTVNSGTGTVSMKLIKPLIAGAF
jgi:hypothetical protein